MANFLIMLYTNQTFQEVSSHLETKDFTPYIYGKLTDLYKASGYLSQIEDFLLISQQSVKYDCNQFYANLNNYYFNKIVERYKNMNSTYKLYFTLGFFCEVSNVMNFKNYKTAYMQLYNPVESIMQSFESGEYSYILKFIENNNVPGLQIFFFITYIYLLDIMNENIENVYVYMVNEINSKLDIMGIIFLIAFIQLVISVFTIFSRNMDKDCQNFIQMRKIFKVCNLNE